MHAAFGHVLVHVSVCVCVNVDSFSRTCAYLCTTDRVHEFLCWLNLNRAECLVLVQYSSKPLHEFNPYFRTWKWWPIDHCSTRVAKVFYLMLVCPTGLFNAQIWNWKCFLEFSNLISTCLWGLSIAPVGSFSSSRFAPLVPQNPAYASANILSLTWGNSYFTTKKNIVNARIFR